MTTGNSTLKVNIENISKVTCYNTNCKHKLTYGFLCNLKHIEIDEDGKCVDFEQILQYRVISNPFADSANTTCCDCDSGCGHDHV